MEPSDLRLAKHASHGTGGVLKRRGLIAAVAAISAGLMAKVSTRVVEATDNSPVVLGQTQTSTNPTVINRSGPSTPAFWVTNNAGSAVNGSGTNGAIGLSGSSDVGVGTFSTSITNAGVLGVSTNYAGVSGLSTPGPGVAGSSSNGTAVLGQSSAGSGVVGQAAGGQPGVFGVGNSGAGVQGLSTNSAGVRGDSVNNAGVIGTANGGNGVSGLSATGFAVFGNSPGGIGVFGVSTSGVAGRFDGNVSINGDFSATGMKSAIVVAKDGVARRLYCMEAPDSWFEDIQEASIAGGPVVIEIDRDFASVVDLDSTYHVFLTPHGDCNGLYVSNKTNHSFVVGELKKGASSVGFSYRIVAKRRDINAKRLNRESRPRRLAPTELPNIGPPPEPPKPLEPRPIPNINELRPR